MPAKRKHPIRTIVVVLVVLGLGGLAALRIMDTRKAASEKQSAGGRGAASGMPVPVVAGTVESKDVPIYLDGLGTVQALNTVTVRVRVDGQIEKIAFNEGQDLKEGDLLAQIDPAPYKALLDQAVAKQKQDEAQLNNAKRDLERDTDMLQKKVIAQQQFDYQTAQVAQLEAMVKTDIAGVDNAKVQLAYTTVTSPINGRTGIRLVDKGNIVHASDATGIVVITQLHPISLIFTLPEQNLTEIQKQSKDGVELKVLAIARDNKTVLGEGKLTVIDNQIDTTTGTIRLKGEFPNEDEQLWPGQFVNARLLVNTRKGGLVVPSAVVQRGPDGSYAYVIKDEGADSEGKPQHSAEMRPIKVAQVDHGVALIDDGLAAGESVVVDGQYKLSPGSKVRLGPAPGHTGGANPHGQAAPQAGPGGHGKKAGGEGHNKSSQP